MDKELVIAAIKTVYDPEISVNVYDLGLIYDIKVNDNVVEILMTLTSPFCPAGDIIIYDIETQVKSEGADEVKINITFQPPWGPERITDEGKLELGLI